MKIHKFRNYFLNLILIWISILLYFVTNYYKNFLRSETQITLLILASTYTILGFFYYWLIPASKIQTGKGELFFKGIAKLIKLNKPEKDEKNAILFMLVKFFFLPIMLNFLLNNFFSAKYQLSSLTLSSFTTIQNFNSILFPLILTLLFLIDTLWFAFGYAFESGILKNKLISVEPTLFGWAVALACYPPFNSFITKHINWYANDHAFFFNDLTTFIFRIIVILLIGIYVSATLALGTKCSNLTNRGIVERFPYSIIRHPAYISKNLAWWLTIIPVATLPAILSMSAWSIIYHLRSLTEERHLNKDYNYRIYKQKIKWRYIPGIY